MKIENRFLKYVSFDTQSDPHSKTTPSTYKQLDLADFLVEEMRILGLVNVIKDEYGVVYGTIPSNNDHVGDVIGFIAHMDTAWDASGANIKPQIIRNYDGSIIPLNDHMNLDPKNYPALLSLKHHDLITTDGTTLLGGDDKAGIAIIMSMAEYLYRHPEFKHNDIRIAFTPDEEIGQGTKNFNIERFNADFAYTLDGGDIHEFYYENFNAFDVHITIHGTASHTGYAYKTMIHSPSIAFEFDRMLPAHKKAELTKDREGFHYLKEIKGQCEKTVMEYIIRDHDYNECINQIKDFYRIADYFNSYYGKDIVEVEDQMRYLNMKDKVMLRPEIIEQVLTAMKDIDLEPRIVPVRGGTDGARLTQMGLPCPNLGTGGFNAHSVYEFVSITMMKKGVELLLKLIKNNVDIHN